MSLVAKLIVGVVVVVVVGGGGGLTGVASSRWCCAIGLKTSIGTAVVVVVVDISR